MGNNGSALGDEPNAAIAQKNLQHFDHSFKAELHTIVGTSLAPVLGECKFAKRPISVICKGGELEVVEDVGITARKQASLRYAEIIGISWDHANSEVKLAIKNSEDTESYLIFTLANSIEFEGELKLRLNGVAAANRDFKVPSPMYVGMFAGATKPKPFQRKRPNVSNLPSGKLPTLHDMRNSALDLHKGSYRPCPPGESRRLDIALQHIYEGVNIFHLINVRGVSSISNQFRSDSLLIISDEAIIFKPRGEHSDQKIEFNFEDIVDWNAVDNDNYRTNDSGIEIISGNGETIFFGVSYVRDVKHSLEYFWNNYKVANGGTVKLGSTHGRPIVSVHTLSGEQSSPEPPVGHFEVVDQDGIIVRPGAKVVPRRASISTVATKETKVVPPENREVKKHWHKVVLHQGWLLKQGGVGVGNNKSWIKRYFVLYKTSQGHFLVYYSDFTECPMFTTEKNHRNIVDLAKATFIRPGSNKAENPETPPYSFDIVTTEREWTLCAESQENVQKWLKLITRAVDEDVAILPDEELVFKVKPKVDPLGVLPATDYSTSLKVSANGISVCTPANDQGGGGSGGISNFVAKLDASPDREVYFWIYTDFYKWSLLSQQGKLALLVNVFADSSFSRRNEYIFRTKEAVRLATAIEYFIEKFMTVMHIRLESTPGAFDDVPDKPAPSTGLHHVNPEDTRDDEVSYPEELDLLGLDINSPGKPSQQNNGDAFGSADPFGDSPFGMDPPSKPVPSAPPASTSRYGNDLLDILDAPMPVTTASSNKPVASFDNDPFGSSPFGDPFGAPAPVTQTKVAPPLSPSQIEQHKKWLQNLLTTSTGPFYDDGTLQVACKVEIRGSQCRVTFNYRNQSPATLSEFNVSITDPAGLTRFDLSPIANSIAGLGQASQTMMLECVKPASPGPQISFNYVDTLVGKRSNTLNLPLIVTSFNEPLTLAGDTFMSHWQQLSAPGQEGQEVLKPSYQLSPAQIHQAFNLMFKFNRVSGVPDSSELVLYGAASLRTGAMTAAGEKISVGCLAKVEINVAANAIRVTLRTLHPAATTAVLQTFKAFLA
eukprot:gene4272-6051_t